MGNCQFERPQTQGEDSQISYQKIKSSQQSSGQKDKKNREEETKKGDKDESDVSQYVPPLIPRFPIIRKPAPQFQAIAYFNKVIEIKLSDYKGKYLVLFFFPFDFSNLCHQEILQFSDMHSQFTKLNCELLGCSMDSQFVHENYCNKPRGEGGLQGINFPLLSDVDRSISYNYGVIIEEGEEKGANLRATFIIDKKQVMRHANVNDLDANIDVNEVLRMVKAFQYADEHGTCIHQTTNQGQQPKLILNNTPTSNQNDKQIQSQKSEDSGGSNLLNVYQQQIQNQDKKEESSTPHVVQIARRASIAQGGMQLRQMSSGGIDSQSKPLLVNPNNQNQNFVNMNLDLARQHGGAGRKRSILKKRVLFDRMGGELQIKQFVKKFFQYVKEDSRINFFFGNCVDHERLHEHFALYLIQIMGGPPCGSNVKDLVTAHQHLAIDEVQFDAFCEVLEGSMIEAGMDDDAIRELFIFIEPQRDQVVNKDRALPLIKRIGGQTVLDKLVELEFQKIANDARIIEELKKNDIDLNTLKKLQKDFFQAALQPDGYNGKQMRDLHRSLNVSKNTFDYILDNFNKTVKDLKIEGGCGRELLILMEPTLAYKPQIKGKETIYSKLGGEVAVEKIVIVFYNKVLQDNILKEFFKNVDINKLRQHQKSFLCFVFGGTQKYNGKTMRDAHWHLELQDSQFNQFKQLFIDTLKDFKVQEDIIKEVAEFIENIRGDIVSIIPPLYKRIGGEEVFEKIVDKFFSKILADKRIKQFFDHSNTETLKKFFKHFILATLGGLNRYTGKSMKEAHSTLNLDDMHFNVFKDYFVECVKEEQIALSIVNEVGRVLETFRHDIVMHHSSVYDIIGGESNLAKVVNQTLDKCYSDNSLKQIFKKVNKVALNEHLKYYLSFLLGGPNNYTGRRLAVAHKAHRITDTQFTIFVNHLMNGFSSLGLDSISINHIQNLLEALRGEVIKRPPTLYERIGGSVAVPDAIGYFSDIDWSRHTSSLISFFTMITGGQNVYEGKSLKEAHNHLGLSPPIFDQFKKLMNDTMFEMGAEHNDILEVMNLMETLRTEVIGSKPPSIMDKLGGEAEVKRIVEKFFNKIQEHKQYGPFFKKVNFKTHKEKFVDFLATTIGGIQKRYKGKNLKDAHWKLNIKNQQFDDFKKMFIQVLEEDKVPFDLKKEIEQFWDSLRPQVVQQKVESEEEISSEDDAKQKNKKNKQQQQQKEEKKEKKEEVKKDDEEEEEEEGEEESD